MVRFPTADAKKVVVVYLAEDPSSLDSNNVDQFFSCFKTSLVRNIVCAGRLERTEHLYRAGCFCGHVERTQALPMG